MDELADRIIGHYERHALEWDADRNSCVDPWGDKPWHERFVAALPDMRAFSIWVAAPVRSSPDISLRVAFA